MAQEVCDAIAFKNKHVCFVEWSSKNHKTNLKHCQLKKMSCSIIYYHKDFCFHIKMHFCSFPNLVVYLNKKVHMLYMES
jgi:hypothetical protein